MIEADQRHCVLYASNHLITLSMHEPALHSGRVIVIEMRCVVVRERQTAERAQSLLSLKINIISLQPTI